MRAQRWTLVALLASGAACVPNAQLRPQASAQTVAGDQAAAVTEAAGVRLVADGDAWRFNPGNLERRLTPVEVRLENHSGRPLSVKYEHFALQGGTRFRYAALPPLSLGSNEALSQAPESGTGGAGSVGLSWGTGWGRYWGHGRGWGPRGWYDPFWGSPFYPPPGYVAACREQLPTRDMLGKALPEGTLEEGGTLTGFLYFQGVADRENAVTLQARLVDARSGETFGTLDIPFQVRR